MFVRLAEASAPTCHPHSKNACESAAHLISSRVSTSTYTVAVAIIATFQKKGPRQGTRAIAVAPTEMEAARAVLGSAREFANVRALRHLFLGIFDACMMRPPESHEHYRRVPGWEIAIKWRPRRPSHENP